MRLSLAFSLVFLIVTASPATAERPRRVITEDASAWECRTVSAPIPPEPPVLTEPPVPSEPTVLTEQPPPTEICTFIQVTRSRYSDGVEDTLLLFSLRENDVEISIFPTSFVRIDSQHFVMDREGTRAILNYRPSPADGQPGPGITVVWDATDAFSSRSFSTEVIRAKTAKGFTRSRHTEREQQLSANAEAVVIDADGVERLMSFSTRALLEDGEFPSVLLTIRKTIDRTRLEEGEVFPDPAQ